MLLIEMVQYFYFKKIFYNCYCVLVYTIYILKASFHTIIIVLKRS